jgi:hypothetical protein
MKSSSIAILLLLLATCAKAQENKAFNDYAKKEKSAMLRSYANHDITGYRKILNEFISRYDKLSGQEKE